MAAIIGAKSTSRSTDCFNTHACHLGPRPASRASNCCVFSAGTATFDPDFQQLTCHTIYPVCSLHALGGPNANIHWLREPCPA